MKIIRVARQHQFLTWHPLAEHEWAGADRMVRESLDTCRRSRAGLHRRRRGHDVLERRVGFEQLYLQGVGTLHFDAAYVFGLARVVFLGTGDIEESSRRGWPSFGFSMRSQLYLKSDACTSRFTGG